MQIQILTDGVEIDDKVRGLIEKKLVPKLDKYLTHFDEDAKLATIKLEKRTRWGYKVNLNMNLPGKKHIFAEVKHNDLGAAVVDLREEVERQLIEYKEKLQQKR